MGCCSSSSTKAVERCLVIASLNEKLDIPPTKLLSSADIASGQSTKAEPQKVTSINFVRPFNVRSKKVQGVLNEINEDETLRIASSWQRDDPKQFEVRKTELAGPSDAISSKDSHLSLLSRETDKFVLPIEDEQNYLKNRKAHLWENRTQSAYRVNLRNLGQRRSKSTHLIRFETEPEEDNRNYIKQKKVQMKERDKKFREFYEKLKPEGSSVTASRSDDQNYTKLKAQMPNKDQNIQELNNVVKNSRWNKSQKTWSIHCNIEPEDNEQYFTENIKFLLQEKDQEIRDLNEKLKDVERRSLKSKSFIHCNIEPDEEDQEYIKKMKAQLEEKDRKIKVLNRKSMISEQKRSRRSLSVSRGRQLRSTSDLLRRNSTFALHDKVKSIRNSLAENKKNNAERRRSFSITPRYYIKSETQNDTGKDPTISLNSHSSSSYIVEQEVNSPLIVKQHKAPPLIFGVPTEEAKLRAKSQESIGEETANQWVCSELTLL